MVSICIYKVQSIGAVQINSDIGAKFSFLDMTLLEKYHQLYDQSSQHTCQVECIYFRESKQGHCGEKSIVGRSIPIRRSARPSGGERPLLDWGWLGEEIMSLTDRIHMPANVYQFRYRNSLFIYSLQIKDSNRSIDWPWKGFSTEDPAWHDLWIAQGSL